jgi:hypothetical protein
MTTSPTTNLTRLGFALAWVLFGISLTLPAFKDMSGWACAQSVFTFLFDFEFKEVCSWLYYSAFNLTNLTLLLLPILVFTPFLSRFYLAARWLVGACFLHTLSWFVWGLCNGGIHELKAGYYLWLLAVGVLLASCIARVRSMQNTSPTNTLTQATL